MLIKNLLPDLAVPDIYSIDLKALSKRGIKGVILDIDNTLESHRVPEPSDKVLGFLKALSDEGFKICLISNGRHERVEIFNASLKYPAIAKAGKPKKKSYKKAMELLGLKSTELAMIGDQIFTDVYGGNRSRLYTVLVEPIESIENSFFYIKRFFERRIRQKCKK